MTQALPRPTLTARVTPIMRLLELTDSSSFATSEGINRNEFLLTPGESGEILVELENLSDRPKSWRIKIQADYPARWLRQYTNQVDELDEFQESDESAPSLNWQEQGEIDPRTTLQKTYYLKIPTNFFEQQYAISPDRLHLQLEYQSQIQVYESGHPNPIRYQVFTLQVRPWCSYLSFLPAIYRETDFMGRFLSIFEQAFDPVVQTIDVLWAYLDPLTAPESLLPFLAHWVAWSMDARWDLEQQRRLIRNAITLYRWHGTRWGLRFYLHLYTGLPLDEDIPREADKHISIEEPFHAGLAFGQTSLGEDSVLGGGRPFHFLVRLRLDRPDRIIDESMVREVIEKQKPAFTTYELEIN